MIIDRIPPHDDRTNEHEDWYECSECKPVPNDSENAGEWEAISAQIDYWRDLDLAYWQRRREQAYQAYLDRQLNTKQ